MVNKLLYLVFLVTTPLLALSQFQPQKFGKITKEEIELKKCAKDSSAAAVVLFDKGESRYDFYTTTGNFKVIFTEHQRMKIFSKDGMDIANISIHTYGDNSENSQRIIGFKAFTYNLENGELVKTKIEKSQIFKEKVTDNVTATKFAFPNVKEGSILEYEIIIESGYNLNVNDWAFQGSYPRYWSEYSVSIPEYFIFNRHTKGYEPFKVITSDYESRSINTNNGSLTYRDKVDHYVMVDIPAFKNEPYLDSRENYLSQVTYEINSFQVPGYEYKNYNTTWESISQKLLEDSDFGGQLSGSGFYKEDLQAAIKNDTSEIQKLNSIFNLVKSKVKWNETITKWSKNGVRKAYKEGIGNSAEINLLLVNMLKEAGISAFPVGLSTRSNGLLTFGNPSSTKMNYVVGLARIGNEQIFLDATVPASRPGILPKYCLNDRGLIIDKYVHDWVDLIPTKQSKENNIALFKVEKDGTVSGQIACSKTENIALDKRDTYRTMKSEDLNKELVGKLGDGSVEDVKMENLTDNLDKPFVIKFGFSIPSKASVSENNIYLNPFIWDRYSSNPFKLEKRTYPINFSFPLQEKYTANIQIPDGYTVEELPQNLAVANSNKTAVLMVSYASQGNSIMVSFTLNILKPLFVSNEYEELKEIYNLIVKKQSEQIVLKKS